MCLGFLEISWSHHVGLTLKSPQAVDSCRASHDQLPWCVPAYSASLGIRLLLCTTSRAALTQNVAIGNFALCSVTRIRALMNCIIRSALT